MKVLGMVAYAGVLGLIAVSSGCGGNGNGDGDGGTDQPAGNTDQSNTPTGPPKMTSYDLTIEGVELTIEAPEGLEVQTIGGTIKVGGNGYDLRFASTSASDTKLEMEKKSVVSPNKESIKFLSDDEHGFIAEYEGFGGSKKYKGACVVSVGDKKFSATCNDEDKAKVEGAIGWAKTLKAK